VASGCGSHPPLVALIVVAALAVLAAALGPAAMSSQARGRPIPVLAYYYIWFDRSSWDRAKTDYPSLGRYSSDEARVMRAHIRWAKEAGIDGFIVSWKSTPVLNSRLEKLIRVARAERFKLSIIYQGLDFYREPLPVRRIAGDLDHFITRYARERVFDAFGKPLVIWSGTWRFSRGEVASVTRTRRARLLILASERNTEGYRRLADVVDGDAYYWSSVDPDTFAGYEDKLRDMGRAIHARLGLWIAPAAPGFDARLVGGTRVIAREGGATLRKEFAAAVGSSPDAVGLISWNEFSENSHVEPSQKHDTRYLRMLADIIGQSSRPDFGVAADSSEAGDGPALGIPLLLGWAFLFAGGVLLLRGRRAHS
jgi:hypothetical protein